MRTVRTNCFETNSSSTHSITIETNERVTPDIDILVDDQNFLCPARLTDDAVRAAIKETTNDRYGSSTWKTRAKTKNVKAAILVQYIVSWFESNRAWADGKEQPLDLSKIFKVIADECGYDGITWNTGSWTAYEVESYDNNYGSEFDLVKILGRSMNGEAMIDLDGLRYFIDDVVLDNMKAIVEFDESH